MTQGTQDPPSLKGRYMVLKYGTYKKFLQERNQKIKGKNIFSTKLCSEYQLSPNERCIYIISTLFSF